MYPGETGMKANLLENLNLKDVVETQRKLSVM
jgi:hypothetical protein